MPEYLAPGVFIEETSFRQKSIEGVGTSVAGLVGPTRTGPIRGVPEVVTSYGEFERIFGDCQSLVFSSDGDSLTVPNYSAHAARAFFDNGGKQLYVVRILGGVNDAAADGTGGSAASGASAPAVTDVAFKARFPGAMGNTTLEVHWKNTENLLSDVAVFSSSDGDLLYLSATGVTKSAWVGTLPADDKFPVDVTAIVKRQGLNYEVQGVPVVVTTGTHTAVGGLASLVVAALPATTQAYRTRVRAPQQADLAAGTLVTLRLKKSGASAIDVSAFNASWNFSGLTYDRNKATLTGFLDAAGTTLTLPKGRNPGLSADITLLIPALHGQSDFIDSLSVRLFDLDVRRGGKDGEIIWRVGHVTVAPGTSNSLDALLPASPVLRSDQLAQPVAATLAEGLDGSDVLAALESLFNATDLNPPANSLDGPRYLIALDGGSDGDVPDAADYAGEEDLVVGSTGLTALETAEDVSIVMVPAAAAIADTHAAVLMEMQKHCRRMRYRVGIVDARAGMSLEEVRTFRNNFDDSRLALYYPWVIATDPTGQGTEISLPPSGFMAGVYARTDVDRGVHKAPANEVVLGALRFEQQINKFQQELLNPNGVNCLRSFPGRGHRVWGGRTLSSDPEWKYLNVRRFFLYLERSIEKSTQWAVFEPNGEALWANMRSTVEDFLFNEWKNGRLLGGTPKEAYFVRCDRSTMTQNDIDNGRMVCVVGVAPLRPAEFVIFRIGQKTADA